MCLIEACTVNEPPNRHVKLQKAADWDRLGGEGVLSKCLTGGLFDHGLDWPAGLVSGTVWLRSGWSLAWGVGAVSPFSLHDASLCEAIRSGLQNRQTAFRQAKHSSGGGRMTSPPPISSDFDPHVLLNPFLNVSQCSKGVWPCTLPTLFIL